MSGELAHKSAVEIRIANVGLVPKLDALGAAVAAVRDAHADQMSPRCWRELHAAQEALACAMLAANESPAEGGQQVSQPQEALGGRLNEPACHQHTTPAVAAITAAGTGDVTRATFVDFDGEVLHAEFTGGHSP